MDAEPLTAAQQRISQKRIPEGWHLVRLGDVFEPIVDTGHREDLPVLAVTIDRGVVRRDALDRRQDREVDQDQYLRVRPNDLVYNTMRMWQGASGLAPEEGYVSPAYTVCRPRADECPAFWAQCFKSEHMVRAFRDHSQGFAKDRHRLYFKHFASVPALRPPLAEQQRIAAALAVADNAVMASERAGEHAEITCNVLREALLTQGLDAGNAGFKNTSIGSIPSTWTLHTIESLVESGPTNGRSPPSRSAPPGFMTFSIAAVRDGTVNIRDHLKYVDLPAEEARRFFVARGDVLIVRGNANPDLVGTCGLVLDPPGDCIYPDILMRVRLRSAVNPRFFVSLWNSRRVREQILDRAKTTNGTYKINGEDVRAIQLPVPPVEEQGRFEAIFETTERAVGARRAETSQLRVVRSLLAEQLLTGARRIAERELSR